MKLTNAINEFPWVCIGGKCAQTIFLLNSFGIFHTSGKFLVKFVYRENGTVKFLTKGDNNNVDDRGLYAPGQLWLTKNDVVGRARGFLPYLGMVTIYMNEYPKFKVLKSLNKIEF